MMIHAAIDTSLTCVFAVADGDHILFKGSLDSASRDNDRKLPPWILETLAGIGLKLQDIRRWTVGTGPGSFAGLRSGIAFIKGICAATGAEIRGVPSALSTAAAAQGVAADARIGVLMDGRCGQVIFVPVSNMKLDGEPAALDPEPLLDAANACDAWITPQADLIPPLPEAMRYRAACRSCRNWIHASCCGMTWRVHRPANRSMSARPFSSSQRK